LLVSVGQTTRQRINYFYVNEAILMSEHRTPTYLFQVVMVSFTVCCVFEYCSHITGALKCWGTLAVAQSAPLNPPLARMTWRAAKSLHSSGKHLQLIATDGVPL